jgi:hypothetical protein
MSFYKEILPFIDFVKSIRKLENYLSFDMSFPAKWSIPKSVVDEKQVVGFQHEDPNLKGVSFVTEISQDSVSKTLNTISKLIKLNKEREMKEQLFKQTIDQLKKTFDQYDLDKLQNLYFSFEKEMEDTTNLDTYETGQSEDIELVGE